MNEQRTEPREPTTMGDLMRTLGPSFEGEEGRTAKHPKFQVVAEKLFKEFGEGENPTLRRELFERCQRECQKHGDVAYRIVAGAVRSAKTAREPGRYFAATVARRMREAGFFGDDFGGGW